MIRSLAGVTFVTPDLDAATAAYRDGLGYRTAGQGRVGAELAACWNAPGAVDARMAVLRPESGERRFVRLIEGVPDASYRPMAHQGWLAAEIIVQDVDRLAERLGASGSAFTIIGPPAVLDFDFTDKIKAMQVAGPGGEVLYLTEVGEAIPGFDLPPARSFVGQPFITVLGAGSIEAAASTYEASGFATSPRFQARIEVLSDAHGINRAHRHTLSTVALGDSSLIEIDAVPATATRQPLSSIGLPSGVAMVSFHASDEIAGTRLRIGAVGEWQELLPAGVPGDSVP